MRRAVCVLAVLLACAACTRSGGEADAVLHADLPAEGVGYTAEFSERAETEASGGYAAIVTKGQATFSYGIATGTINVTGVRKTYAGLLVGVAQGECEWILGEAATIDYTYTITIDGEEIPKYDENGDPLTENFCDLEFSQANP